MEHDQIEVWQEASQELQTIRDALMTHLVKELQGPPTRRDFPELARLCRAFIEAWETSGG